MEIFWKPQFRPVTMVAAFLAILLATGPAFAQDATADQSGAPQAKQTDYCVFSFNDLGMHCYDSDYSTFAILPPFNTVHAQVLKVGAVPSLLSNQDVSLFYRAKYDRLKSITFTSANKTNFWDYAQELFGLPAPLPPNQGLTGSQMPGRINVSKPFSGYDPAMKWFTAMGIPMVDRDSRNKFNPFPEMLVSAVDASRKTMASLPTILPVSSEGHCNLCHATGADGASPGFHGVQNWSTKKDLDLQTRENILILHDALNNTSLRTSTPVLCGSCHYQKPLDLAGTGPSGTQINPATGQPYSYLSRAVHRHHGTNQLKGIPIPDEGVNTCYNCHPGTITKCMRGPMAKAGMSCQSCHGGTTAVMLDTRQPWVDLPKCQSCHVGDAVSQNSIYPLFRMAFDPSDPTATPRSAPGSRFAEQPGTLFRNSVEHGGMACEACHGSTHAEWPVINPKGNDNDPPTQLQGHTGPIIECTVCHGQNYTFPSAKPLGGPHGLHTVNDTNWVSGHKNYLPPISGSDMNQCMTCHGLSLSGTVLSKAADDRTFPTMMGNPMTIPAGTPVSCGACHANPLIPVM